MDKEERARKEQVLQRVTKHSEKFIQALTDEELQQRYEERVTEKDEVEYELYRD